MNIVIDNVEHPLERLVYYVDGEDASVVQDVTFIDAAGELHTATKAGRTHTMPIDSLAKTLFRRLGDVLRANRWALNSKPGSELLSVEVGEMKVIVSAHEVCQGMLRYLIFEVEMPEQSFELTQEIEWSGDMRQVLDSALARLVRLRELAKQWVQVKAVIEREGA